MLRLYKLNLLWPLLWSSLLLLSLNSCRTSKESIRVTTDSTTVVRPRQVKLSIPADSLQSELLELAEFSRQLAATKPDGVVVAGRQGRVSYRIKRAPGPALGFVVDAVAEGKDTTVTLADTTRTIRRLEKTTITVEHRKPGLLDRVRDGFGALFWLLVVLLLCWFFIWRRRS